MPRRPKTLPIIDNTWQDRFKAYSLRTGFTLQLTQAMIEFLSATADDVCWDRSLFPGQHRPDNWMATSISLWKRGLIRRKLHEEMTEPARHRPLGVDDGAFEW